MAVRWATVGDEIQADAHARPGRASRSAGHAHPGDAADSRLVLIAARAEDSRETRHRKLAVADSDEIGTPARLREPRIHGGLQVHVVVSGPPFLEDRQVAAVRPEVPREHLGGGRRRVRASLRDHRMQRRDATADQRPRARAAAAPRCSMMLTSVERSRISGAVPAGIACLCAFLASAVRAAASTSPRSGPVRVSQANPSSTIRPSRMSSTARAPRGCRMRPRPVAPALRSRASLRLARRRSCWSTIQESAVQRRPRCGTGGSGWTVLDSADRRRLRCAMGGLGVAGPG